MNTEMMMDLRRFAEEVRERMERTGRFTKVGLEDVLKNNNVKRLGLRLHGGGVNIVPTIYLEPFFKEIGEGIDMDEIVDEILDVYEINVCKESVDLSFFEKFSTTKDRLCMKLVNRAVNAELLERVPHREFLDLAVVYYADCKNPQIGAGTIQVNNYHMNTWGVTEEDLWKAASVNTPLLKPAKIKDIVSILAAMLVSKDSDDNGHGCNCDTVNDAAAMLVLTNVERAFGAAAILYDGVLKQMADQMGCDLFLLPSSVHEFIAVPMKGDVTMEKIPKLNQMIVEVNAGQLLPEEVLSDHAYIYRREQDRVEMA